MAAPPGIAQTGPRGGLPVYSPVGRPDFQWSKEETKTLSARLLPQQRSQGIPATGIAQARKVPPNASSRSWATCGEQQNFNFWATSLQKRTMSRKCAAESTTTNPPRTDSDRGEFKLYFVVGLESTKRSSTRIVKEGFLKF